MCAANHFPKDPDRRGFFKKTFAIVIGIIVNAVPFAAGLAFFFDPLRRKSSSQGTIRVTSLSALPNDSIPRKFSVVSSRSNAWNKEPHVPIGAVYLRRTGEKTISAFNVVCPHAGCFVDYKEERNIYLCPCHNSAFALDGMIANASSPSPRPLDQLEVQIRGEEIWVKFQNFRAGESKKIPAA